MSESGYSPYPPEDFDEFWLHAASEVQVKKLDFHRSLTNDFELPGFVVETIRFVSVNDRIVNGWLAYPDGARRLPSFAWIPPYGRESLLPNAYGTREEFVSISLNLHGLESFHQEKYNPSRGYFAQGAETPESWVFRQMFQDAFMAIRVLQAQVEVDEDRIGVMGMSQGAGISTWLGAWCPIVKAVCADMPFLAGMNRTLLENIYRFPLKELVDFMHSLPVGTERIINTVSYFDTINHATRCHVPTHLSLGLKDPACRPATVRAVFENLPGVKELDVYDWGHDWHPDMISNNRNWLVQNLK